MSGGAAPAAARKFFDGDADEILAMKGIEKDFLALPFDGTTRFTSGTGPVFKTGGHARMLGDAVNPGVTFTANGSGKIAAEFVELACGALLESQMQHGGLPGRNYPRTFLIGPRAAFGIALLGTFGFRKAEWASDARFLPETKVDVYDYDRIVIVNQYAAGKDDPLSSVVITVADLNQSAATDGREVPARDQSAASGGRSVPAPTYTSGVVPALVYTAAYVKGANAVPYTKGNGALTQMKQVLTRLGFDKAIVLPKSLSYEEVFTGSPSYAGWAMLALEHVMRVTLPMTDRAAAAERLFAVGDEKKNRVLMERAVQSGFIPPRTLEQNPVAWPVPTTQDELIVLMEKRLGYGNAPVTFEAIGEVADALDAIARAVLGGGTASEHTYDAFAPDAEEWY